MSALTSFFGVAWVVFWIYWMVSAAGVKRGSRPRVAVLPRLLIIVLVILFEAVFRGHRLTVHNQVLHMVGLILFLSGLGLAVWARIYLGQNWGMPMTRKEEPELVTSGPYRLVRHPIYSGILIAGLGTAAGLSWWWLAVVGLAG